MKITRQIDLVWRYLANEWSDLTNFSRQIKVITKVLIQNNTYQHYIFPSHICILLLCNKSYPPSFFSLPQYFCRSTKGFWWSWKLLYLEYCFLHWLVWIFRLKISRWGVSCKKSRRIQSKVKMGRQLKGEHSIFFL